MSYTFPAHPAIATYALQNATCRSIQAQVGSLVEGISQILCISGALKPSNSIDVFSSIDYSLIFLVEPRQNIKNYSDKRVYL